MGCAPASGGTPRTPSGSTASAWRSARTWAAAWCAPGASSRPRSTSAPWPTGSWGGADLHGLLLDRGFVGRAWAAQHARRGIRVVLAPGRAARRATPAAVRRPVAALRNRVETSLGEITDRLGLARHGAKTFWGLLARTAATLLAHTLARLAWL